MAPCTTYFMPQWQRTTTLRLPAPAPAPAPAPVPAPAPAPLRRAAPRGRALREQGYWSCIVFNMIFFLLPNYRNAYARKSKYIQQAPHPSRPGNRPRLPLSATLDVQHKTSTHPVPPVFPPGHCRPCTATAQLISTPCAWGCPASGNGSGRIGLRTAIAIAVYMYLYIQRI
jgi:hypothetical protein